MSEVMEIESQLNRLNSGFVKITKDAVEIENSLFKMWSSCNFRINWFYVLAKFNTGAQVEPFQSRYYLLQKMYRGVVICILFRKYSVELLVINAMI